MESITPELLGQLGIGAIFLYLYFRERSNSREDLKKKDERIERMTDDLKDAYIRSSVAIEKSNEVSGKILTKIDEFLRK